MNQRCGPRASCLCPALLLLMGTPLPAAAPATTPCEEIVGFNQVSRAPGIFVSDMHGTSQPPAFLRALVCNLMHSGRPVVLALEYPSAEQHFINEFLHASSPTPQRALLASPFWNRPTQDGRTSQAMLSLLEWVRQETADGARIRVVAFDSPPATSNQAGSAASFDARDRAMAQRLRHELSDAAADEMPIIFTGSVHARKTRGLQALNAPPGMENARPLGYRLRDLGFLHMNVAYQGGSAWVCFSASECGVRDLGKAGPTVNSYSIARSTDPAYDLQYSVGALTASPPAATAP